jgi:bifunctional non-homologous end joining protein LigD
VAGLREYHRKRDFKVTTEPRGGDAAVRDGHRFVVQKHAASHLHYDFRLERDGVLKSWAVPKGPSLDPADKRLAMRTEDHPIEYADFEGVIPEGEYGGGSVLLWDRGTWKPLEDPATGERKGRLVFELEGEKLRGRWHLVRTRGRGDKTWLLIKGRDTAARAPDSPPLTETRPESVATGRSMEAIARDRDREWHSNRPAARRRSTRRAAPAPTRTISADRLPGAKRAPMPAHLAPELATLVAAPPAGDGWLHEMKYDGFRMLCRLEKGRARLITRNANDWTERFPTIVQAATTLSASSAILDGEVAFLRPDGTTSFSGLQTSGAADASAGELVFFVFDLPYLDGFDLRAVPLEARKAALRDVLATGPGTAALRYSDHVVGNGEEFFRQACRFALEGVIAKRRDAPYTSGRTRDWVKVKCVQGQEVVIGGFTDPQGRRTGVGALLLGVHDADGRLVYAGKVGTGFTNEQAGALRKKLEALETSASPFVRRPPGAARAHWVEPRLVAEVDFTEWTHDGRLRHPSFKGLRDDKPAREVTRERAATTASRPRRSGHPTTRSRPSATRDEVAGVRLTHPERVVYPEAGITKAALARFYESIADWILPHVVDRPTTLVRCPEGVTGDCFYQKHVGYWAPDALRRVRIREKRKVGEYLVVDDLPGLVGLVQIGIVEIHTWNARTADLDRPDRIVFDLDPGEGVPWAALVAAARLVRARLADVRLESFVKTTGGSGLHVVVPIARGPDWDACAAFTRGVAESLAREAPDGFVATMAKSRRTGRIFVDWLRNTRGATSVAAYSTRARPNATVSTPLAWDELGDQPDRYTVTTLPARLRALRSDPWAAFWTTRQTLPRPAGRRAG